MKLVSWRPAYGARQFGKFIQWSNDYALVRHYNRIIRVHKSDITFEEK